MTNGRSEWKTIADIKDILEKKWQKGTILREVVEPSGLFPMRLSLSGPGPSELSEQFTEVQEWIKEYADADGSGTFSIDWKQANNRVLGRNRIPVAVLFKDLAHIAGFLRKKKEYSLFMQASGELLLAFPDLKVWLLKNINYAAELSPIIGRLIAVTQWIIANPRPGIYLRQLCIERVDTKFIESYKKTIGDWLNILLPPCHINTRYTGGKGFEQRFGFLAKPVLVRFRMLDEDKALGGFSDITVRADEFCRIQQDVRIVFVVENDINCLSFPVVKGGMVLFGRGYGFDFLADADWLKTKTVWYWGDIDTHGFAILGQFREYFPEARAFMMDKNVLLKCRDSWSTETEQSATAPLRLDEEEMRLFHDLKENRLGASVRLEQELIPFDMVRAALSDIDMYHK